MLNYTLTIPFLLIFLGSCQSIVQYTPEDISLDGSQSHDISQKKQTKLYNSFKLGTAYQRHNQDYKAVHYYGSCAQKGDVEAMYRLAQLYRKDKKTQGLYLEWLKQAAKFEHLHALAELAQYEESSRGFTDKTYALYNRAAQVNSAVAHHRLGVHFTQTQDWDKAGYHLKRSVRLGNQKSYLYLGHVILKQKLNTQSRKTALKYYSLGVQASHPREIQRARRIIFSASHNTSAANKALFRKTLTQPKAHAIVQNTAQ